MGAHQFYSFFFLLLVSFIHLNGKYNNYIMRIKCSITLEKEFQKLSLYAKKTNLTYAQFRLILPEHLTKL